MDRYTVTPEVFAHQMDFLVGNGWNVESLGTLVRRGFAGGARRTVAITFDDGFESNREFAWPVLRAHGLPSTTFIVSDRIGEFNSWDRPDDARWGLLDEARMRDAAAGKMDFASHSATHVRLPLISQEAAALDHELSGSIKRLERLPVSTERIFAYPFGDWNSDVVNAVKSAGYFAACSCIEGLNSPTTDRFLLRRVEIKSTDIGWRFSLKLMTGRDLFSVDQIRASRVARSIRNCLVASRRWSPRGRSKRA